MRQFNEFFISLVCIPLCRELKTEWMPKPDGMQDCRTDETASIDDSEDIMETLVPYDAPKDLPQEEGCPKDDDWSIFMEVVSQDSPFQCLPLGGSIPEAFDSVFKSVLYSSCQDYQLWIKEAANLMQTVGQLKEKVC